MKKLVALALIFSFAFLPNCSDKNEYLYNPVQVPNSEAKISPNTKIILKEVIGKNLIAKDSTTLIFKRGNSEIENLKINDIVVSDSGNGLLRKIVKVEHVSDQIRLETAQAALTEAFEKCRIDYKKPITADMIKNVWLADGIIMSPLNKSLFKPEQIEFTFKFAKIKFPDKDANPYCELSGQVSFTADFEFYLDIDDSGLKEFKCGIKGAINPQIEYSANGEIKLINQKFLLNNIQFNPITILVLTPIGLPVPVVITPELRIYICLEADLSVGISSSISCKTGLSAGIQYVNSQPGFYLDPVFEPSFEWPQPSGGFAIKIYPENQFDLFLYGIAGPSLILKPFIEFDYDHFRKPSAELNVGFEGGGGIYLRILDKTLINYSDSSFWKLKWKIWSNPTITKIEPTNVKVSDELTISGLAFGVGGIFQGDSYVSFNDIKATNYKRWENEKIIVQVPENAKSGKLTVFVPIYIPINPPIILLPIVLNNGPLIPSNQVDYYINNTNPTNGSITGKITDASDSNPIYGATIITQPPTSTVTSDISGYYTINNVSPGSYTIAATKAGYNDGGVIVTVQAGSITTANIQLSKSGVTPTQGLVAYYPFNGNTNDESGNGNHGTVYGANLTNDRSNNFNKAYYFDGIDDYILVPNSASLNLKNALTISAWIKFPTIPANGSHIVMKSQRAGTYEYGLNLNTEHSGAISASIGGYNVINVVSNPVTISTWYHVVATWQYPGISEIYLNGARHKSVTTIGNIDPINCPLTIGRIRPDESRSNYNGIVDDVRIYNRVLSSSEIQALYHEGGW